MTQPSASTAQDRLERLLGFVEADPANPALIGDTAEAAFAAGNSTLALHLIERCREIGELPAHLVNLAGIIALTERRYADAITQFSTLRKAGIDAPAIRFNLAWAHAMTGNFADSLSYLDDEAVASSPRGPTLKVQALHHLGDLLPVLDEGRRLLVLYPHDDNLLGAMAMLALDADDIASARQWAVAAPANHQALTVLGMLALDGHRGHDAHDLFDKALALQPGSPRAQVGKGLLCLAEGNYRDAVGWLDAGSISFGTHLGSWIAAGWANLLAGNAEKAAAAFERVRSIDDTFSESHGGLAVLALLGGCRKDAERHCEVALRLDRQSMGGTLAKVLLLQGADQPELAERLLTTALQKALGASQMSLGERLTRFARRA